MGTAFYMSPEQARGRAADKRTDIWSFGCVLFEALTGKKAFDGESVADVLSAIMKTEPDWRALPDEVPPVVRRVLRRCLKKKQEDRLHDVADARLDLEDVDGEVALSTGSDAPRSQSRSRRSSFGTFLAGIAVGALLGLLALTFWKTAARSDSPATVRLSVPLGEEVHSIPSWRMAISSDGKQLVYTKFVEGSQLMLRPLDSVDTKLLGRGGYPFFSRDGRFIVFSSSPGGELHTRALEGGTAPPIARDVMMTLGGDWGLDDRIYLPKDYASEIIRVPAGGGNFEPVTKLGAKEIAHWWPRMLPNGRSLSYTAVTTDGNYQVRVQDMSSGESRTIVDLGYNARYASSGHLLFGRNGSLWAVPFDLKSASADGEAVEVLKSVYTDPGNRYVGADVSKAPSFTPTKKATPLLYG
jgi:serine/threonine-protein kinase